jgi:hypothetical protein
MRVWISKILVIETVLCKSPYDECQGIMGALQKLKDECSGDLDSTECSHTMTVVDTKPLLVNAFTKGREKFDDCDLMFCRLAYEHMGIYVRMGFEPEHKRWREYNIIKGILDYRRHRLNGSPPTRLANQEGFPVTAEHFHGTCDHVYNWFQGYINDPGIAASGNAIST